MNAPTSPCEPLIPLPIVRLNRAVIVAGVALALVLHAPLITTALFVVIALAAGFGRRASVIYQLGILAFPPREGAEGEDPELMRFNNVLAALMLGGSQLAFLLGAPLVGWAFAILTAVAAAVALAGFCFGCFLYYQFKSRRRLGSS